MRAKIIIPIIFTLVLGGLMTWKLSVNKKKMAESIENSLIVNTTIPVIVEIPIVSNFNDEIVLHGTVIPENEVTILSKLQGIVTEKYKKAGQAVRKGDPIVQIENEVLKKNLQAAQANYAKIKNDVARYQSLKDNGAVAGQELESVQMSLRDAEERIIGLEDQIASSTIYSPVNGTIADDFIEQGQLVMAGGQIAQIISGKGLKLTVSATESDIVEIRKGQPVNVTVNALANESFAGKVEFIAPKANDLHFYAVDIELQGNANELKAGMYASANFEVSRDMTSPLDIMISRKAIVGSIKKPYVYILKNGKAVKKEIKPGPYDEKQVVVHSGITIQDTVINSGQINLSEGSSVSILNK